MENNPENNEVKEEVSNKEMSQIFSSEQLNIEISKKIIFALEKKADEFNQESSAKKVSLEQLKKVYRSGANICCPNKNKNQCALARVNMFLSMISGSPLKEITADLEKPMIHLEEIQLKEVEDQDHYPSQYDIDGYDISESWVPSDDSFLSAEKDIKKYDLSFDFVSVDDLYLDNPLRPVRWLEE